MVNNFDEERFPNIQLRIITKHPTAKQLKRYYQRQGWSIDDDVVHLIGENKHKPTSWKHVYYKGNLSLLGRPTMSMQAFEGMFGNVS